MAFRYTPVNNYRNEKTPLKAFGKDFLLGLHRFKLFLLNGKKFKTILFYPEFPAWNARIRITSMNNNFHLTSNPKKRFDYVFYWEDSTTRKHDELIKRLAQDYKVINFNCTDISKKTVDKIFYDVFGYSSLVDPLKYEGICVQKSDRNGAHDGKIINCPIPKDQVKTDCIYQLLIENKVEGGLYYDCRVHIYMGDLLPIVNRRYKSDKDRFDQTIKDEIVDFSENFSEEEANKIKSFCQAIRLDYGELDILRDINTNKIYIVDANNTPLSRPPHVKIDQDQEIMEKEFTTNYLKGMLSSLGHSNSFTLSVICI